MPTITSKQALNPEQLLHKRETCLAILRDIYRCRFVDDKMSKLVRQNKGGTFFLSTKGHELVGALCAHGLNAGSDWAFPYYRDRSFAIALGSQLEELFGVFLGRTVKNHSAGRMMPEHFSDKSLRIPCQSSCVGSQFLQAVGCAKALKIAKSNEIVYVSAGDGATSQGDFHEALNFACIHQLNIIFVIQDNGWAISVPVKDQTAGGKISKIARGYENLSVFDCDGTDFFEVTEALTQAVGKARSNQGPSLIVADVPRLEAHSNSDDPLKYREEEHLEEDQSRDPLPRYEDLMLSLELITESELKELREQIRQEVEQAAQEAEKLPFPEPDSVTDHIFKSVEEPAAVEGNEGPSVVIIDALNHALDEEMERNPHLIVFGEDVAHGKGGVFGVTRKLTEKHSVEKCFNTPLAESTVVGIAIGMSFVEGFCPVAEIQFADYIWPAMNQLINELASIHYRSNGEWNCPVVIRIPCGGYIQGGPYHSQSIEAYLAHCPGLKIAIPSNSADAKRMLKMAIRDPNPVVFLEHKALYRQRKYCARPEPSSNSLLPLGKADVVRTGSDMTIVAWGMTVLMAVEVADKLAKEGYEIEVIDLRTIAPLDIETINSSLRKTGKLLIAHEAPQNGGFGAEIAARIAETEFTYLDAPVKRIAAKDCMVSYSKVLEDATLPQTSDVENAARSLLNY